MKKNWERFHDLWHRKLTLKVKLRHFLSLPYYINSQNSIISLGMLIFRQNFFHFCTPAWKIDNPYYHNCRHCYDVHKGRCNYTLVNGIKTFCCDECGKTFKVSFHGRASKLKRFLAQNQLVKCVVKKCLNLAFKVNFLCQKSSESSFFLTFLIF